MRWVDGQPVYRRVFIAVSGAAADANNTLIHIPNGWGFFGLVRLDGYLTGTTDVRYPVGYWGATNDYFSCRITGDGDIIERHGGADKASRPVILIVDYISEPTGTSSWDQGVTAWDAGTSTWDQITRMGEPLWDGGDALWDKRR